MVCNLLIYTHNIFLVSSSVLAQMRTNIKIVEGKICNYIPTPHTPILEIWSQCRCNKVERDDSKPVDSKLQELVNLLLLTKISNHSINHMIDSKQLAIANNFVHLKKFTKARFDCTLAFWWKFATVNKCLQTY